MNHQPTTSSALPGITIFSLLFLFCACKKSTLVVPSPPPNPPATSSCQLVQWKSSETADPLFFEYAGSGKLLKARAFKNGIGNPPSTTVFVYDGSNQLTSSYDSAAFAANDQYTSITTYSNFSSAGYPQHSVERVKAHRDYETDFVYDGANRITRATIQSYDMNDAPYSKDTVDYVYDAKGNFLQGLAHTALNGIRAVYTAVEIEGYDAKPNFYKSLGTEFNLHRIANSDAYSAAGYFGYYLYMPSANNPLKVFLHNQGTGSKGDFLTYTYDYESKTNLPSKITYTNTSGGIVRGPATASVLYNCK